MWDLAFHFLGVGREVIFLSRKQTDFFNSNFQKSPTLKRLSSWPPTVRIAGIGLMRWVGSIVGEEDWHKGNAFVDVLQDERGCSWAL